MEIGSWLTPFRARESISVRASQRAGYNTPQKLDRWLRCKIAAEFMERQMPKQRKRYDAAIKAKVALEAIKGQRTINEIALPTKSIRTK